MFIHILCVHRKERTIQQDCIGNVGYLLSLNSFVLGNRGFGIVVTISKSSIFPIQNSGFNVLVVALNFVCRKH